jgi:recombination protein RecT
MATGELVRKSDQRVTVRGWFEAQKGEIARAVPKHIDPERLVRVALTACVQNPKLLECTRESLMQAVMQSAQLGLMPDGLLGGAYLVPYRNGKTGAMEATFQVGFPGLIDLATRGDRISAVIPDVVHAKDYFEYHREVERDVFKHKPYEGDDDPGPLTHAYCLVRRKDGTASVTVLPKSKIEKEHRAHSRAKNEGPWSTHYEAMCKKTMVIVALKYEPKSTDLAKAVAREEFIEQGIEIPPEDVKILDAAEAKAEPQTSALDRLAAADGGGVPPCAGCGKNKPAPLAVDAEGRAFHKDCLDVLKSQEAARKA